MTLFQFRNRFFGLELCRCRFALCLLLLLTGMSSSLEAAVPNSLNYQHYLVSDYRQGVIRRYDLSGQYIDDFITGLGTSAEMEIGPDGLLYVASSAARGILKFDPHTAEPHGIVTTGGFFPRGFTWGPNGNLFAARASQNVLEFDPSTGTLLNIFVPGVENPTSLQFGNDEILYVARGQLGGVSAIDKFDATTGAFVGVLSSSITNMPTDLLILPNDSMYVTNQGPGPVLTVAKVFRPSGLADPSFQPGIALGNPVALKSFSSGELLVVDSLSGIVRLDVNSGAYLGYLIKDLTRLTSVADIVLVVPEPSVSVCFCTIIVFGIALKLRELLALPN